jgi:hypothetical protein
MNATDFCRIAMMRSGVPLFADRCQGAARAPRRTLS